MSWVTKVHTRTRVHPPNIRNGIALAYLGVRIYARAYALNNSDNNIKRGNAYSISHTRVHLRASNLRRIFMQGSLTCLTNNLMYHAYQTKKNKIARQRRVRVRAYVSTAYTQQGGMRGNLICAYVCSMHARTLYH